MNVYLTSRRKPTMNPAHVSTIRESVSDQSSTSDFSLFSHQLRGGIGIRGRLRLGVRVHGRHRDGVALRLEAVLVGHPVDDHRDVVAVLVLGGEAVGAALHGARLLSDLLQLAADVLRGRVGCLVGVLEAVAVRRLRGLHPQDAVVGQSLLLRPGGGHGQQSEADKLKRPAQCMGLGWEWRGSPL